MSSSVRFLGVDLSEGVRPRHLLAYFLLALISSAYAGSMSVLQPGLLFAIGIPPEQQGMLTGMLSTVQEIVLISVLGPIGALAERYGRRSVYVAGMLLSALGFALYPFATSIPLLVVFRIIVALGGAAILGMMVTVIADYSRDETRGKANGIQGLIATLGAFVPPILAGLPAGFVAGGMSQLDAQRAVFGVAASMGAIGAVAAWFGLARIRPVAAAAREKFLTILEDGFVAARDPHIALSYGAAFISRGDLAVTGAFMSLWLIQHGTLVMGMEISEAMAVLAMPRILAVVGGAAIGAIIAGILADKVTRVTAVAMASGLAGLVYCSVGLVSDPTAPWVMGLLAVMGVAEISAFVSSQALVGERAQADRRGAVIGFFGVAGAVGILVATAGGGALFSQVGPSVPFVLFGVLNFIVFFWAMWMRSRDAAESKARVSEVS